MWEEIVVIISTLLALILGVYWRKAKKLIKAASELLTEVSKAMEDNKLTKAEIAIILEKIKRLLNGTP